MNDNLLFALIDPILAPLEALPSGARVIDVGCGSGEIDFELARRRPDLRITGIDINPAVLPESAGNVEFREMDMTALEIEDAVADAVISRLGLLNPTAPQFARSAEEAARILAPGGLLSLAAWSTLDDSPYTRVGLAVLRRIEPPVQIPDLEPVFAKSARPGALEGHLKAAGLQNIQASWFDFAMEFSSFESWWQFNTGLPPFKAVFDALDEKQLQQAREEMLKDLAEFESPSGSYPLPARVRYITAVRS
jgi:SAM-dependent methyltransferase